MLSSRRVHPTLPSPDPEALKPFYEAEVRELRERGVVFEEYQAPRTEDGIATMPAGRAAWMKDPDGNLIGLFQFNEPV